MSTITGGKSKFVSLLMLVKNLRPELYEAICDLHLDGTFRTQRHKNTFLLPSKALVGKIAKLIKDDKDEEAIDTIRSLILKGHLAKTDFSKDAKIGTLQYEPSVLEEPVDVAKSISASGVEIIVNREGSHATVVYDYDGKDFPKTIPGKTASGGLVGQISGGVVDADIEVVKNMAQKMVVKDDVKKTFSNFKKGVSALVGRIMEDESRSDRIKHFMAANPVLSWFFLTMPGLKHSLVKSEDIKDLDWSSGDSSMLDDACRPSKSTDSIISQVNKTRRSLFSEIDIATASKSVNTVYEKFIKAHKDDKDVVDELFVQHPSLKILMDCLRFQFDDAIDSEDLDTALTILGSIDWSSPEKHNTIMAKHDRSKPNSGDLFECGIKKFICSIYFVNVPLSKSTEEKLINACDEIRGGSASGNRIVYFGGAARKATKSKKTVDSKMKALVKGLSKSQKAALKSLL